MCRLFGQRFELLMSRSTGGFLRYAKTVPLNHTVNISPARNYARELSEAANYRACVERFGNLFVFGCWKIFEK